MLDVHSFTVGPVQENCYIVGPAGSAHAVVIDPGEEAPRLIDCDSPARPDDRRDPPHPHPLRSRRRRRPTRRPHPRPRLVPRARAPRPRRHRRLRPLARLRPVRELSGRPRDRRRRDPTPRRARDRRRLHPGSQPRPRHLRDPLRRRPLCRRRPLRGLDRPDRLSRRRPRRPARVDRPPARHAIPIGRPSTRVTWGSPRSPPNAPTTRFSASSRESRDDPGSPRHLRRPPRPDRPPRRGRADGRPAPRGRRLRPHRDPRLRVDRALRPRRRPVDRHRPEGDVHLRGLRPPLADTPSRGHRTRLPGLRRARDAQAPGARQALLLLELLPLREAPGGPLPPVLAGRRRGSRVPRPGDRRRIDRPRPHHPPLPRRPRPPPPAREPRQPRYAVNLPG